jgi:DNA-directed RNA polymerase specialized sigma24 family protein
LSVFSNNELSCLETIVKYLKENLELNFSKIASVLNRDQRTIWSTYSKAAKKKKEIFCITNFENNIPLEIFTNREIGVLENICLYLKDVRKFTFHQIAILLNRNDRTIWTSYHKARGKTQR